MKAYASQDVRNLAVAGHSHCGKTTLISSLLHTARAIPELNTALLAYDEEEQARRTTLSNAVAWCEWDGVKMNLVDTPGFNLFVHEAKGAMLPVEAVLIVVDAVNGPEPMTERVWNYAEEFNLPRVLLVNRMDREHADSEATLNSLREAFGRQVVPVQLPIGSERGFSGVVDLVTMQAFQYRAGGNGRGVAGPIPPEMAEQAKRAHESLVELVAEGKDELMEEYFAQGTIPEEHLLVALHEAIREDRIFPVLFASGLGSVASDHLLDFLKLYIPAASERMPIAVRASGVGRASGHSEEMVLRPVEDSQPVALYVFKTISDPFAGHISFFKVLSGCLKNDTAVENFSRGGVEKMSHLAVMQGKKSTPVDELHAGDIGAVAKLKHTLTGDTLGDRVHPIFLDPVPVPEPAMTFAIEPKTRADEDKLSNGLHLLMEEDTAVRFYRDPQTHEFLIGGTGQQHIEVVVSKLKRRFHTEVTLKPPKVPYRETIRDRAEAQGRHKKQSGGHGQFGDCKIRIEPLPRGAGFEFVNDIFGGAIPRTFIPAVQKGIEETAVRGFLAGYPVVDFRVTLIDGSYHEVDSNELSFKNAGRIAFRKAMEQTRPVLLEPVMHVEIEAPEEFAGALMGDLNGRRGRVLGMDRAEARGSSHTNATSTGHPSRRGVGICILKAEIPMAEMLTYGADLVAMTQGRGSFHMQMDHYEIVPALQQEKIVAHAKASNAVSDAEVD